MVEAEALPYRRSKPRSTDPNWAAKALTPELVLQMREQYAAGSDVPPLAESAGVNVASAYKAISGRTWKHLPNIPEMRESSFAKKGAPACHPDRPYKAMGQCESCYQLDMSLKYKYGIDRAGYDRMLKEQDGACRICRKKPRTRRLAVDHDHKTNEVRGLLCSRCNEGLGRFEWDEKVLTNLIVYAVLILRGRNKAMDEDAAILNEAKRLLGVE